MSELVVPALPTSLIARILTYNVVDTKDVARLRLVGKMVGQQAIQLLPGEQQDANRSHWIRCPERRLGDNDLNGSFAESLCGLNLESFGNYYVLMGDIYEIPSYEVSLVVDNSTASSASNVIVRVVDEPRSILDARAAMDPANHTIAAATNNEVELLEKLRHICDSVVDANSVERLKVLFEDTKAAKVFFQPPPENDATRAALMLAREEQQQITQRYFAIPAMVTLTIDPSVVDREVEHQGTNYYQISLVDNTTTATTNEEDEEEADVDNKTEPFFQPLYPGSSIWAVDAGQARHDASLRRIHALLMLKAEYDRVSDGDFQPDKALLFQGFWQEHQQHQYVEGVVVVDDLVSNEFRQLLNAQVDDLAQKQERDHAVDYHPHSNRVVRDLVHPALYSYIQDVTPLIANVGDVEPCKFSNIIDDENNIIVKQDPDKDFWGRTYETSTYQWLPSYVSISANGKCTIDTYINNLTPREDPVHSVLYKSLEKLLERALPFIESVLSYVYAVRPLLRYQDGPGEMEYNTDPLGAMNVKFISLRGQKLQVITKIVDYELTPLQEHDSYEGVWHVEGMSHEEIVLTCLYILDRDEAIVGAEIEFQRAFLQDEAQFIFSSVDQMRPQALSDLVDEGVVPLGSVATPLGRLVVFPNSHVHRVKEMKFVRLHAHDLEEDNEKRAAVTAKRRIVVFFVVNPQRRIVSTREVAPQQIHSGGKLPHEEALKHRLALMSERKYKKQDWNIRPIELCEH